MGGGPLLVYLSATAFSVGLLPTTFTIWLLLRRMFPRTEWLNALKAVAVGRMVAAIFAGFLLPVALAAVGLIVAYVARESKAVATYSAVLGGWVWEGQSRSVGRVALISSWVVYGFSVVIVGPIEQRVEVLVNRRFAKEDVLRRNRRAIRLSHVAQGLAAVAVWWEVHT